MKEYQMKNFEQEGCILPLAAPSGGVVSGTPYLIGGLFVVAGADGAEGVTTAFSTEGVFNSLPKTTGEAWTVGAKLYWNSGTGKLTTTAGSNLYVANAAVAALAADTTGTARLNGVAI